MKKCLILLGITLLFLPAYAQQSVVEEEVDGIFISPYYSIQLPAADLSERFGLSHSAGLCFDYKLGEWTFGVDAAMIFGGNVKEDSILRAITTQVGGTIDEDGYLVGYKLEERGLNVSAQLGRIFPVIGPNDNSGLYVKLGLGYLQHKILIDADEKNVPQLSDEYQTGYDRLSGGMMLKQSVGYLHFSNSGFTNFYVGLEFTQAITKLKRNWVFDQTNPDFSGRTDLLFGLKFAWIIPTFGGTSPQEKGFEFGP